MKKDMPLEGLWWSHDSGSAGSVEKYWGVFLVS